MTNLKNRDISRVAVNNALLPSVNLVGHVWRGTGLAGVSNPCGGVTSTVPLGYGGSFENAFNNTAPNYFVGLNVAIPIRNRQAKSDQYRSELETRQAEIQLQQQRKQIRIEVRNAQYALQQSRARVAAAMKARDLAAKDVRHYRQGAATGRRQRAGDAGGAAGSGDGGQRAGGGADGLSEVARGAGAGDWNDAGGERRFCRISAYRCADRAGDECSPLAEPCRRW